MGVEMEGGSESGKIAMVAMWWFCSGDRWMVAVVVWYRLIGNCSMGVTLLIATLDLEIVERRWWLGCWGQ